METMKFIMVGDGNVGKTCMLIMYTTNTFPNDYIPTVVDSFSTSIIYNDAPCRLEIWDTAGQEEYACLRPLSYDGTDVFFLCFAIDEPTSYSNAEKSWYPEIRHFRPNAIVILVGTKCDKREDEKTIENLRKIGRCPVTYEQGLLLAKRINANKYMECSALTKIGLKEVFEYGVMAHIKRKMTPIKPKRRFCSIL